MRQLTYGSLFAGVGGFDQGFDAAGMACCWQVEWDKNCQKLLKQKWPEAKHYGDITSVRAGDLDSVDVVCGGSPCQNLSVAGERQGLAGGQSGLFFGMVRICKRIRPRYIVWENVDGAFSSNGGRDFAAVIRAFTGVQVEVPTDGWGRAGFVKTAFPEWRWNVAWRVFDAQYFGVPQRRRRVFLVASFGDASCVEILFEPESVRGNPPPIRKKGEETSANTGVCAEEGSGIADSLRTKRPGEGGLAGDDTHLVPEISPAMNCQSGSHHAPDTKAYVVEVAPCITGSYGKQPDNSNTSSGPMLLAVTSSQDLIGFHPTQDPIHSSDGSIHSISCGSSGGTATAAISWPGIGVRRLTPLECERLMGWPDNHTAGFADGPRYKMCGNGVVKPCSAWIAKRIAETFHQVTR